MSKKPLEKETSMLSDDDDVMSPIEELTEEEVEEPEDPSDEPVHRPVGRVEVPVQQQRAPWGGPNRGQGTNK